MRKANYWQDYMILDAGDQEKLEKIGPYTVIRPDPVAIWPKQKPNLWQKVDAAYSRSKQGGGAWTFHTKMKEAWVLPYRQLKFEVSLTNFKHFGLFPEQATNWDWMQETLNQSSRKDIKVLNLFAYTGGATIACAQCENVIEVVHVDAAKGMVDWAKTNVKLNHLDHKTIRYIVDDCVKFVNREVKRGRRYDVVILDPPSYGRGPNNEVWKIEEQLVPLLNLIKQVLSDDPCFVLLNSYTTNLSASVIDNIMRSTLGNNVSVDEIGLPIIDSQLNLPAGVSGIWKP
jgi:23S rRNA (cytosine1962-C5)-methyltransferase